MLIFPLQVFSRDSALLCLILAKGSSVFGVSGVLQSLRPVPALALLTGACSAPLSLAAGGDVVLVGRSAKTVSIPAELQHACRLWRLQGKEGWREHCSSPRAQEKSEFEQALCLARLHAELQVRRWSAEHVMAPLFLAPPTSSQCGREDCSQWFRGLQPEEARPLHEGAAFRQHVPDPSKLWAKLEVGMLGLQWRASCSVAWCVCARVRSALSSVEAQVLVCLKWPQPPPPCTYWSAPSHWSSQHPLLALHLSLPTLSPLPPPSGDLSRCLPLPRGQGLSHLQP